jgi:hypothetical protein
MGVFRKSLPRSGKVLYTAFSTILTHTTSTKMALHLLRRNSTRMCRMPLVVICVIPSLPAILVIMCDSTVSTFVGDGKGRDFAPEQGNLLWIPDNGLNSLAVLQDYLGFEII